MEGKRQKEKGKKYQTKLFAFSLLPFSIAILPRAPLKLPLMEQNPWETRSTKEIYENAWIKVREDQVIRPDGKNGIYGVVSMKNRAIGVLPLHDDRTVTLVGQFRYTMDEYSWEIPEGGCPPDEAPEAAARRELREETGLSAQEIRPLGGEFHLSNSVTDERASLFVATGLSQGQSSPEGTEELQVKRIPLEKAVEMVLNGEIRDGLSALAILLAQREFGQTPEKIEPQMNADKRG